MFRFTIRDVLWLMVVVGLAAALTIQHQKASTARKRVIAALNRDLVEAVDFVEMPIDEAMLFISVKEGVPIFVKDNWNGRTVTARFQKATLRDALEAMLPPLGMDYQIEDGWILVRNRNP